MKNKGRKGKGFGRLFAGPDERAQAASRRDPVPEEPEVETPEDIAAKYGKYLDGDGVPLKGINPKPKYYIVPKEPPREERQIRTQPVHQIKTQPAQKTLREPIRVPIKKVRKSTHRKVVVKKPAKPVTEATAPKKVTVRKASRASQTEPAKQEKTAHTVTIKVKSKS